MVDQDFLSFDSFCAECRENRTVQRSKADLVKAIANAQNVRLFSWYVVGTFGIFPQAKGTSFENFAGCDRIDLGLQRSHRRQPIKYRPAGYHVASGAQLVLSAVFMRR